MARVEIDVFEGAEWLKLNDSIPPAAAQALQNQGEEVAEFTVSKFRLLCEFSSGISGYFCKKYPQYFLCALLLLLPGKCRQTRMQ